MAPIVPVSNAAAAAAQLARREEEEALCTYEHVSEQYEYKIMRGNYATHERLEEMLREEAVYGWQMMEVFDVNRIRLRRPAAERMNDAERGGQPYRTFKPVPIGCNVKVCLLAMAGLAVFAGLLSALAMSS